MTLTRPRKKFARKERGILRRTLFIEHLEVRDLMTSGLGLLFSAGGEGESNSASGLLAANSRHNADRAADVNADQQVTPIDALLVINLLHRDAEMSAAAGEATNAYFADVSNDGFVSPLDALIVINELNVHGEPPPVDEPLPPACTAADTAQTIITSCEVKQLLARAAAASASEGAIIAIVDRGGHILGVRSEQDVLDTLSDELTTVFAIDGAVAKARTAAFFSNNEAPLTSRTIRFISQSTITQREVEANPTVPNPLVDNPFDPFDPTSLTFGPGFVAPIGLGGHFPPGVAHTPPVDLFAIEHQSRDGLVHPGIDEIKGTGDDLVLASRFNVDPVNIPAGKKLEAPESYGVQTGLVTHAQSRGIATLPGGLPLYKNGNLVGGIGVFFPGPDGYATHEQNFIPLVGQTAEQRLNAPQVLESEWIAFAAAGGLLPNCIKNAPVGSLGGIGPLPGYGLPFGRIDLVGITLEIFGPNPTQANPRMGVDTLLAVGAAVGQGAATTGLNQVVNPGLDLDPSTSIDNLFALDGAPVPEGWLVKPTGSGALSAADVERIIMQGVAEANLVRAAIRLDGSRCPPLPGPRTKMVFAVADTDGVVLGLFRMPDATVFSIDVAVAKARNTAYYADPLAIAADDLVDDDLLVARGVLTASQLTAAHIATNGTLGIPDLYANAQSSLLSSSLAGIAFTNRTFRFLAEPRYPAGVDGSLPPIFSILNDPGIHRTTAENLGAPTPASEFESVLGFTAFHPNRNFRDPDNLANQNGVVFFPGSTPLYVGGVLVGGFGVSGDGVDQDDVVTASGMVGFAPPASIRVDQVFYRGARLPFQKFNRNPRR